MRAEKPMREQSDTGASYDVVDTSDHRRRGGQECDAAPELERWNRGSSGPLPMFRTEVLNSLRSQRAVIAPDACDAAKAPQSLATDVYEPNDGEESKQEQRRQHCCHEHFECLAGLADKSNGDERAGEREDVDRRPRCRFAHRRTRSRLKHEVLGRQCGEEQRMPFFLVHLNGRMLLQCRYWRLLRRHHNLLGQSQSRIDLSASFSSL